MKVLVVGGGGREHAIIKKIKENKSITKIYALPGNGGIAKDAECVDIKAKDIDGIVKFAVENEIDFAIVAPDDPLVLGCVDKLEENKILCFGPNRRAAKIEGSKVFAKNLMKRFGIPTAEYEVFNNIQEAINYALKCPIPIVVKADGLALGKGVFVCHSRDEVKEAIMSLMNDLVFGSSGNKIVMEEFLTGPEVSVLAFTDGKTIVPMISSMDHKCAYDGDQGPNTGGMGTIAPNPYYTEEIAKECMEEIFIPTIEAMNKDGRKFKGCLYFGLMLTENGPKVIEYNCRFGDPEAQVVLPLLKSDLFDIFQHVANETLNKAKIEFSDECACCVIMASNGYPGKYSIGYEINIPKESFSKVYIAGAKEENGKLITSGGRVLGVVETARELKEAIDNTYKTVEKIAFQSAYFRHDIGQKALKAIE